MFKYFCHCNKEVEKVLLEDISKDMEILHELESFNSSLDFMQEKFSEKNQNKALAVVFWLIWRQWLIKFSRKNLFTVKNIIENRKWKTWYCENFLILMKCLGGRFEVNARVHFWKFWNCLSKTRATSKFSKITSVIYPRNRSNKTCGCWLITPNQETFCIETNIF